MTDLNTIIEWAGNSIYFFQALGAIYGIYCTVVVLRRISEKRFSNSATAEAFLTEVDEQLKKRDFEAIAEICDSPPFWAKAVPQLILVALANRQRPMSKLRQILAEKFERDVIADIEYRVAGINTVVKSEPMLGLLGTVAGMISAFGKIAAKQKTGSDPSMLASDISLALITTAVGLVVAIPLIMVGAVIHVRLSKMQDSVQDHLSHFLESLDVALAPASKKDRPARMTNDE